MPSRELDINVAVTARLLQALRYSVIRERMPHFCGWNHNRHARRDPRFPDGRAEEPRRAGSLPTHQEIAELAYFHWEARGRPHGSDGEDWLRAERELVARREAVVSTLDMDAPVRPAP